jgi:hypothetical protein
MALYDNSNSSNSSRRNSDVWSCFGHLASDADSVETMSVTSVISDDKLRELTILEYVKLGDSYSVVRVLSINPDLKDMIDHDTGCGLLHIACQIGDFLIGNLIYIYIYIIY